MGTYITILIHMRFLGSDQDRGFRESELDSVFFSRVGSGFGDFFEGRVFRVGSGSKF